MIRKFTSEEKSILYKGIPIHKQKGEVGWEIWLFLGVNFGLWIPEIMLLSNVTSKNGEIQGPDFLIEIMTFAFIVWAMVQLFLVFIIFMFFRDQIIYSRYGEYAVENTFETEKINIIQSNDPLSFIIQLSDYKGNKTGMKTNVELNADVGYKQKILSELEKFRKNNSGKIDLSIQEIIKLKGKPYNNSYILFHIKNLSTPAKFDFTGRIYQYEELLRTQYELIFCLKTKELLFIGLKKGKVFDFQSDIIIEDVENKIHFISYEDG